MKIPIRDKRIILKNNIEQCILRGIMGSCGQLKVTLIHRSDITHKNYYILSQIEVNSAYDAIPFDSLNTHWDEFGRAICIINNIAYRIRGFDVIKVENKNE